jgi:uncharacterized repeat protein (TIGR03803 family)
MGSNVTSIGDSAFYATSITSITIPNSVTNIGYYAFNNCNSLTAITVNTGNPAYISVSGVLFNQNQTTLIQYPASKAGNAYAVSNSVTNIEFNGFEYCTMLTSVTIPSSVTSIGTNAFSYCTSLTNFTVATGNSFFGSTNGVLFNQNQTVLIQYPEGKGGSYAVPSSVVSIATNAFYYCISLTNIMIGTNVTSIGDEAFDQCNKLSSAMIGNSVTNIGNYAFYYCNGLTSVTIGTNVISIGNDAFVNDNLISLTIPNSVISIGDNAFVGNWSLTSVVFGTNVTAIGTNAFNLCYSLPSVTIPSSVTRIGDGAFGDCYNLTGVYFTGNAPNADSTVFTGDANATIYYLPGTIGWSSPFCGLPTGLWDPQIQCAYIIINGTITIIGHNGPGGAVTIPITITGLPVTSIGSNAFNSFNSLTSITIPNSVTNIGVNAFASCYSLNSVTIPNSVINIGVGAFQSCFNLASLNIGSSVTSIGTNAFNSCYALTSITIPNSVTNIGDDAFEYCSRLTSVYFQGNAPSADSSVFTNDNTTVYYLPGSSGWSTTFGGVPAKQLSALVVTTASLPNGTNGVVYSQTLTASGGQPPYKWTNIVGALPLGLSLATNGVISGTPTFAGTTNFTVKVTDATNSTAMQALSLTINSSALQVTTAWLFGGTTTVAYSQTLTASGGQPPYRWTNIVGALPLGLSLATNGVISGTPTFAGTTNFTVKVTDATNSTATQALSLTISVFSPLQIMTSSLPNGTNGVAYSQQLSAAYGQPPYSWSLIYGSLPSGLTLSTNGVISGVPPSIGIGTASFTVKVTDALSMTATEPLTLTVLLRILHSFTNGSDGAVPHAGLILSGNTLYGTTEEGGTIFAINNGSGTVFSINTDGTGFTNLYNFTAINHYTNRDGAGPEGSLILSGNTLYGTTFIGGNPGYGTIFAVNTNGTGFTNLFNFDYYDGLAVEAGLILSGNTLYGAAAGGGGSSFDGTVFAISSNGSGFTNLYNFSALVSNTNSDGYQPTGSLLLSGNKLYGTASAGGTNGNGTVFAVNTDGSGFIDLHSFTTTINNGFPTNYDGTHPVAGLILSGNTLYGTASGGGTNGHGTVFAVNTDGSGFKILYSFSDGDSAPEGSLILSGNTLYGTTSGDQNGGEGTVFAVNTDGTSFTNLYNFTGGSNGLYSRCSLVLSGNTLYGTTDQGGSFGYGTVFALWLGSVNPSLQISTTSLLNGTNGLAYSQTLTASGGQPPYSWTNSSGSLPPGLTLATNGVISGIPTAAGTSNFTVQVTDISSDMATQALSLTINVPLPVFQSAKFSNGQFMLTWSAVSNGVYQLQYKTNLTQASWINIGSSITASNTVLSVTNAINTDNQRFYRVQQQ